MTAPTTNPGLVTPPSGVLVGKFEPGSDAWHQARAQGIGGSEIAAILGLSPYESRFSLWHRKKGLVREPQQSDAMEWGNRLEDAIAGKYADEHPEQQVAKAGTFRHPKHDWWIVNPDRFAINPDGTVEIIEIKTAYRDDNWGPAGTDQFPIWYRCQVQWYLAALGLQKARLIVLISGSDYREYEIEADPAEVQILADAGADFMRTLREDERPDIDGHSATYQVVKTLPDGLDDVEVEIDAELRDRYFTALDTFKQAETEKRAASALLLDRIGTGRRATHGDRTIATRTVRDGKTYSLMPAKNRSTAA